MHGGWGVEALTGVSRPHGDIDLLVPVAERPKATEIFAGNIIKKSKHKIKVRYKDVKVEVSFFERRPDGSLTIDMPFYMIFVPKGYNDEQIGKLGGVEVATASRFILYGEVMLKGQKTTVTQASNVEDASPVATLLNDEEKQWAKKYFPENITLWKALLHRFGLG
ncbi:MAG: hypothetical protein K1X53_06675 [Candidatus Sumerlaeaceae bacterium]|nr:hypothetical protein [Candidatus Sumerlaeaceae bacterium]